MEEATAATATVPIRSLEDKQAPDSRSDVQANGHFSEEAARNAVLQNDSSDEQSRGPHQHPKTPSSENQDARLEAFEKQYRALQQQLRQRDVAMMDLADENEHLNRALTELKESLKDAIVDRDRLTEKIKRQQISLQGVEASLRKTQAEAIEARREANEAKRDANDARREATESSVSLADAKAEVWAIQQAAKGKALGEDERRELEGALRALSASAQRAAQEAGSWKESADNLKGQVESLKADIDAKAHTLSLMENELTMSRQQGNDSELRVQEAGRLQSMAENALQELRQESDRRARTFNSAVKAAVSKIQTDLEAERDLALGRISNLQSEIESQADSLKEKMDTLATAELDHSAAKKMIDQLEEERNATKAELSKLQEQVDSWQSTARLAGEKTDAAQALVEDLTSKIAKLESRCEELTESSDSAIRNAALVETTLVSDMSRLKSALTSAQNENQLLQITSSEKMSKAVAEQIALRVTISELEGQLVASRTETSGKGSPGVKSDYWLDNLGLERVNWKSKLRHQDVEKHAGKRAAKDGSQASTSYDSTRWSWTHSSNQDNSLLRGRLSKRSIIMIIYIAVLHILVMVSFTRRSQTCVDTLGEDLAGKLPGL